MYINMPKIAVAKMVNAVIIAAIGLPTLAAALFTVMAMTSWELMLLAFILFPFVATGIGVIVWRIFAVKRFTRAFNYNSLIEGDHDGILTYESIASMMGIPEYKVVKELMWMQKKGYLKNITLGRSALRVDLQADQNEFLQLGCPTCGSVVRVRRGGGGRCDHCGTYVRDGEA